MSNITAGTLTNDSPTSRSSKTSPLFTGLQGAMDEGSFFIGTNVPGTAIATTTSVVDDAATQSSTHAQASPVMLLQNQNATGGYNVYPVYLKMFIVQVPTSATSWKYALRLDNLSTKLTTAGTVITPVQPNPAQTSKSNCYITFGAITTVIMSGQGRLVGNGQVSGAIPVALDQWYFAFGQASSSPDSIGTQTLVKSLTIPVPPICIPPGWFLTLEMWGTSNAAAPSWEFEFGYIERPAGQ